MFIRLLAAGTKPPQWVSTAYGEYAKRLPRECRLELQEMPVLRRARSSPVEAIRRKEGEKMLQAVPARSHVVALDVGGKQWSTEGLSAQLGRWMSNMSSITLMIGGPDGLSPECLQRADTKWSLSELTFPHLLVRVMVAEQIYRAWTVMQGHPYHRGG